jgi:hypothetical protein
MRVFLIPVLPLPFLVILHRFQYDLLPSYLPMPVRELRCRAYREPLRAVLSPVALRPFGHPPLFLVRIRVLSSLVTLVVFITLLLIGL